MRSQLEAEIDCLQSDLQKLRDELEQVRHVLLYYWYASMSRKVLLFKMCNLYAGACCESGSKALLLGPAAEASRIRRRVI